MLGYSTGQIFIEVHQVCVPEVHGLSGAMLDEIVEGGNDRFANGTLEHATFLEVADQVDRTGAPFPCFENASRLSPEGSEA